MGTELIWTTGMHNQGTSMKNNNDLLCPVCGFQLGFKAWDGDIDSQEICPSCGTQFGYNDAVRHQGDKDKTAKKYQEIREHWIKGGMKWWSTDAVHHAQPVGWDPVEQLKSISQI